MEMWRVESRDWRLQRRGVGATLEGRRAGRLGQVAQQVGRLAPDSHVVRISGTEIREQLSRKKAPPETMMRGDVAEVLLDLERNGKAFCD